MDSVILLKSIFWSLNIVSDSISKIWFFHISIEIWKFFNIDQKYILIFYIYRSIYMNFNIDRYMCTYFDSKSDLLNQRLGPSLLTVKWIHLVIEPTEFLPKR